MVRTAFDSLSLPARSVRTTSGLLAIASASRIPSHHTSSISHHPIHHASRDSLDSARAIHHTTFCFTPHAPSLIHWLSLPYSHTRLAYGRPAPSPVTLAPGARLIRQRGAMGIRRARGAGRATRGGLLFVLDRKGCVGVGVGVGVGGGTATAILAWIGLVFSRTQFGWAGRIYC
jgi:hypothetical protein